MEFNFTTILAILFFFGAFTLIIKFIEILIFYLFTINKWKSTKGIITKSYVDVSTGGAAGDGAWEAIVNYQYKIEEETFYSDVISKNIKINMPFKESAYYFYSTEYPEGKKVTVFYNPHKKSESVLENKFSPVNLIYPAFAVMVIILATYIY